MKRPSETGRLPLVVSNHSKRSVGIWILLLAMILAVMFFLPRLLALLEG